VIDSENADDAFRHRSTSPRLRAVHCSLAAETRRAKNYINRPSSAAEVKR
jgi:hypothetical protein